MCLTTTKTSPTTVATFCLLTFATLLLPPGISGGKYGLKDDQHPSVVHLEISGDPRSVTGCCPRCSGVLISLKHVATVATCLWSKVEALPNPKNINVYAGTSEVSGRVFTDYKPQMGYGACSRSVQHVTALEVIYHPKFQPQFHPLRHDVAIVVIPKLQATRFVMPIQLGFDMFDDGYGSSNECKIVGFGILKFPRAGYYNLLTWLQPLTRWERVVTVTNGCMGKPIDWSKKKWHSMIENSLCSKVYSSESRVCWNDKGAALICNGLLAGLVQGQYEDGGKLDLSLRQCSDTDVNSTGKISRQQVIFFNVKYLAELIPTQIAGQGTRELQWTGGDNETLTRELALAFISDYVTYKDVVRAPTTTISGPLGSSVGQSSTNSSDVDATPQPSLQPPKATTTDPSTKKSDILMGTEFVRNLPDDLPEFGMNMVTSESSAEEGFSQVNVDDVFNENNPFNASWSHVHHLAIILNQHFHQACTGVFISPRSILTGASCLVRRQENYLPLGASNYRVITGHSNGMVDFCSERIRMYDVQNVTLLNQGLRHPWQLYRKSRIAPYTEIYNLAVLTIAGAHLSTDSYPSVNDTTWQLPLSFPYSSRDESLPSITSYKDKTQSDRKPMQCRIFSYGHMDYPYTNQNDRIGIKSLELEITDNCSRPFYDFPFGEESENLWLNTERPHFLCAINLSPNLGPSAGSIGAPLYCGPTNKLVGLYIGRYSNRSFDSYVDPKPQADDHHTDGHTHVFLKLEDYSDWIGDVLLDDRYVQLRLLRRSRLSLAPPLGPLEVVYLCLLAVMPRLMRMSEM